MKIQMKKIINNIISFSKSFYGLIIYFAVNIIFEYIIVRMPNLNTITYSMLLISSELVLTFLLILIFKKRLKKDFIDFDKNYKKYLILGIKVWLIGIVVMAISNSIIYKFFTNSIAYNQEVNQMVMSKMPLFSVIGMIITGPFIEEIVFRLSFKEHLKNKVMFYVLTVLIFTGMHVLNGISSPLQLLFFIPYGSLALSFAYILDKTNNIFTTIIIHTMHNSIAVVLIAIASIMGV